MLENLTRTLKKFSFPIIMFVGAAGILTTIMIGTVLYPNKQDRIIVPNLRIVF